MTKPSRSTVASRHNAGRQKQQELYPELPSQYHLGDKEVDLQFLTFIELHACNPIRSEVLGYLGNHPEQPVSAKEIAREIGRSPRLVHLELYELALWNIVEPALQNDKRKFRLSEQQATRDLAIRFALAMAEASD
ncbi:MAG: hypothetical protein GXP41_10360 [Chloroflexi bacterium]|nr:hypothetical protein [Chloroflexota bacterium]